MKNYLMLILLSTFLVGCDSPQRTRAPAKWITGNSLDDSGNGWTVNNPSTTSGSSGNIGSTSGSNSGNSGYANCDLSDKYHTIDIGFFGLCQSTVNETLFKFRASLTSTSVRTCLIPTYKESNGSSTYIGQPQCTYTTSNKEISGQLVKNRQGFEHYPLNGVIVMKEPLTAEYFACMNAFVNWPANVCPNGQATNQYCSYWVPRCPNGAQTGSLCDAPAREYMSQTCTSFKTRYSNAYIDIRLKP
jgi:hypothetical protein